MLCSSFAFAEGFSGWASIGYNYSENRDEGEVMLERSAFTRNAYLELDKSVTRVVRYRLTARTNFTDTERTNEDDDTTSATAGIIEPAGDIFFRNPIYYLNLGYIYREMRLSAQNQDESESKSHFYYSRFNMTPYGLPNLALQFEGREELSGASGSELENTSQLYNASSGYEYRVKGLKAFYGLTYSHSVEETPDRTVIETRTDLENIYYGLEHAAKFLQGNGSVFSSYKANYLSTEREIHTASSDASGTVQFKRFPLDGLHALGTVLQPSVDVLNSTGALIDEDLTTGLPSINIGIQLYHNTGIFVVSGESVDRLYIYVNQDVSSDVNLSNTAGWDVYWTDANVPGTVWSPVALQSVVVTAVDVINSVYRYELIFNSSRNAPYFKAVNMNTVNAVGVTNVEVTEIEAYGSEKLSGTGVERTTTESHRQELFLGGNANLGRVRLTGTYSISKRNNGLVSVGESTGNLFRNIFGKPGKDEETEANVEFIRFYRAGLLWSIQPMLMTDLDISRRETYDNQNNKDDHTNTYKLTFTSAPLPTLDTNLAFVRTENYRLQERESTTLTALLTIGTKLYPGVDMVTDMGYGTKESFTADTITDTYFINGNLNAKITDRLSGNLIYGIDWNTTDGETIKSDVWDVYLTYQPGKRISFSGNFQTATTESSQTTRQQIFIDWIPVRSVRLSGNYQHRESKPGPVINDQAYAAVNWTINRYLAFNYSLNYTADRNSMEEETYRFNAVIRGRF
jgi:hypothetical protein